MRASTARAAARTSTRAATPPGVVRAPSLVRTVAPLDRSRFVYGESMQATRMGVRPPTRGVACTESVVVRGLRAGHGTGTDGTGTRSDHSSDRPADCGSGRGDRRSLPGEDGRCASVSAAPLDGIRVIDLTTTFMGP